MGRAGRSYLLQQVNICPIGISTFKPVLHKDPGEPCVRLLSLGCEKKESHFKDKRKKAGTHPQTFEHVYPAEFNNNNESCDINKHLPTSVHKHYFQFKKYHNVLY